jgi:hypothetical protein
MFQLLYHLPSMHFTLDALTARENSSRASTRFAAARRRRKKDSSFSTVIVLETFREVSSGQQHAMPSLPAGPINPHSVDG